MDERVITVTEASRNFSDLVNRTCYRGESTVLTRSGKAVARVVPVDHKPVDGVEWIDRWKQMTRLGADDAEDFARTIREAKGKMELPTSPWDS